MQTAVALKNLPGSNPLCLKALQHTQPQIRNPRSAKQLPQSGLNVAPMVTEATGATIAKLEHTDLQGCLVGGVAGVIENKDVLILAGGTGAEGAFEFLRLKGVLDSGSRIEYV